MRIAPFFMVAPYHRADMDKTHDHQAHWRTGLQIVACIGMVGGGLWLFLGDTILALLFPNLARAVRIGCMAAAAVSTVCGGAAYWSSLRRLRPDPQN